MDNLEGTPPWLSFQPACGVTLVNGLLTGGGHVCEERSDDMWDGFV